ncbi:MAG: hypothetical protein A2X49_00020 [Lentisphaerae bacterium GWF2_52_8]|nr:MAG: hypothetical protein A2X49_00020 [Lentisphaerae bacterium GWF2_52_8]
MKLGTFTVDFTPPLGSPIFLGTPSDPRAEGVRDPLLLRGFVLQDSSRRYLIASLDYCGLMNSAQDELLTCLGKATDTPKDQVLVHCVHQHDAPLIDFEIEPYLGIKTFPHDCWMGFLKKAAESARKCLGKMKEISAIGHSETRICGYASNRRIIGEDGMLSAMRWSRCGDAKLRSLPTGIIDPILRSLAFKGSSGRILGSMSFYATHPQVSNGRKLYSADAPGEALRIVSSGSAASGLHAFFTGAGGNVTAGKYSSPEKLEENLSHFGKLLADGIKRNLSSLEWEKPGCLDWKIISFRFPRKKIDVKALQALLDDSSAPNPQRLVSAVILSAYKYKPNRNYRATLIKTGGCRLLFLPGEPFVEYQLWAQSLVPDEFLAVIGNCGNNFVYLPTKQAIAQGGYEPGFSCCSKAFEARFKKNIAPAINDTGTQNGQP